jgi:hypothetical protein
MTRGTEVIVGVGLGDRPRKSHWPARMDLAQSASGLLLGLSLWGHRFCGCRSRSTTVPVSGWRPLTAGLGPEIILARLRCSSSSAVCQSIPGRLD